MKVRITKQIIQAQKINRGGYTKPSIAYSRDGTNGSKKCLQSEI
jgi:hypothetical protein